MLAGLKGRFILALSVLFLASFFAFSEDIGAYRIPMHVTYAGTHLDPGLYKISIDPGADGPMLVLSKNGAVVAGDLAIVIAAKSRGPKSVQIAGIAGQEFLRIRVRSGSNWYYAYLEKTK